MQGEGLLGCSIGCSVELRRAVLSMAQDGAGHCRVGRARWSEVGWGEGRESQDKAWRVVRTERPMFSDMFLHNS